MRLAERYYIDFGYPVKYWTQCLITDLGFYYHHLN